MSIIKKILIAMVFMGSAAHASVGVYVGAGVPFLGQAGLNYKMSDTFSFSAGYNMLDLSSGDASVVLSMPELMVNYHPFSGSFFLGAGVGQNNLEVSATELTTGYKAEAEVSSLATIVKAGWMWGIDDGGFWFGVDTAFISPSSSDITITAPNLAKTSQEYKDVEEAAEKYGETAFPNVTFARIGYLF